MTHRAAFIEGLFQGLGSFITVSVGCYVVYHKFLSLKPRAPGAPRYRVDVWMEDHGVSVTRTWKSEPHHDEGNHYD